MHALEWLLTEKFFLWAVWIFTWSTFILEWISERIEKIARNKKKKLTYNNVFVNDRHDFQNYCVWIVVHVHLLPRFKFNQDKKKL